MIQIKVDKNTDTKVLSLVTTKYNTIDIFLNDTITIMPGSWYAIFTGIKLIVPKNHYLEVKDSNDISKYNLINHNFIYNEGDNYLNVKIYNLDSGKPCLLRSGQNISQLFINKSLGFKIKK